MFKITKLIIPNVLLNLRFKSYRIYFRTLERGTAMRNFDKISIQEMSKDDMLLIIEALEYTGKNTKINEFIQLRNNILQELSSLAEISEEQFLEYLKEETLSI